MLSKSHILIMHLKFTGNTGLCWIYFVKFFYFVSSEILIVGEYVSECDHWGEGGGFPLNWFRNILI